MFSCCGSTQKSTWLEQEYYTSSNCCSFTVRWIKGNHCGFTLYVLTTIALIALLAVMDKGIQRDTLTGVFVGGQAFIFALHYLKYKRELKLGYKPFLEHSLTSPLSLVLKDIPSYMKTLGLNDFKDFFTRYPTIRAIYVDDSLQNEQILEMLKNCSELTHLTFENCNITDESLITIIASCKKITYLSIFGCNSITEKGLVGIAKCLKLESLELRTSILNDTILEAIGALANLNHLGVELSNLTKITSKGLLALQEQAKRANPPFGMSYRDLNGESSDSDVDDFWQERDEFLAYLQYLTKSQASSSSSSNLPTITMENLRAFRKDYIRNAYNRHISGFASYNHNSEGM